jgi:hypothetical protein
MLVPNFIAIVGLLISFPSSHLSGGRDGNTNTIAQFFWTAFKEMNSMIVHIPLIDSRSGMEPIRLCLKHPISVGVESSHIFPLNARISPTAGCVTQVVTFVSFFGRCDSEAHLVSQTAGTFTKNYYL